MGSTSTSDSISLVWWIESTRNAVTRPELMYVSMVDNQHAIGPRIIGNLWGNTRGSGRLNTDESASGSDGFFILCIKNINTKIITIGQIQLLGYWIEPTNVNAPPAIGTIL